MPKVNRAVLGGGGAIGVVVVIIIWLVFAGSQIKPILHTVGAAIPPNEGAASATKAAAGGAAPLATSAADPAPSAAADDSLKIVYTGTLDLVVDDLDAALARGRMAVLAAGGYVGGSDESRKDGAQTAAITYRIPAARWQDTLASLRGIGRQVVGEKTQASAVGGQIVDLEARLRNLRASEQVLVGIAQGTKDVKDLLDVQQRISDVRGQIEELDGQRAALADQVAYGTLVTTYGLQVIQVEQAKAGWNPATDVDAASATMVGVGQTVISDAIWFGIVWLPGIVILVGLLLVGRRVIGRFAPRWPRGLPLPGGG